MPFTAERLGDFCAAAHCGKPIVPGDRIAGGPHPKPFYHIECWPRESQAPRSSEGQRVPQDHFEFELSTKRDPRPERRVVKVICPRGTTATEQADLMHELREFLRVSHGRT